MRSYWISTRVGRFLSRKEKWYWNISTEIWGFSCSQISVSAQKSPLSVGIIDV